MKKSQKFQKGQTNNKIKTKVKEQNTIFNDTSWWTINDSPQNTCTYNAHTINYQGWTKTYRKKGDEAILKEVKQLYTRQALMPWSRHEMSYNQSKKALRYLMFLREKKDGTIKARGCADGRPQRIYTYKEDTGLPTVSIEAMMLSSAIDAKYVRKSTWWLFHCFCKD